MASVKKTRKSSETKQAKQPGIRSPKAKASKRSAVSVETKAKKAAAARALAAKQRAVKKSTKGTTQKAKMKANAKTKTAAALTSRATPPATKNKNKAVATAPAAKKTAVTERRGKAALTSAPAPKRTAAAKPAEAARQAVSSKPARSKLAATAKKTPVLDVSHGKAAKPAAAARAVADAKIRDTQKPAATKEAAAALLAFKRNVARLSEMRKQAAEAPAEQPVVTHSDAPLETSERMAVIKDSNKKISVGPVLAQSDTARLPEKDSVARETASAATKGAAMPLEAKAAPKVLVSKMAPPLENPPVAADAAQANLAAARPAEKPAAPAPKSAKTGNPQRQSFKPGEYVVYPAHGVGQIIAIEEQEVAGFKLELFVISFIKDKMILKVPTPKVVSVGMRKLSDAAAVKTALDTLAGRARVKRTMWSRRAQEYEAKINSGDLNAIAEVVRDLYRSDMQPEQSYSERQLYEAALDRMTREILVVQKLTETESLKVIEAQLQKGPRRGKAEDIDPEDAEIEEAA